MVNRSLKNVW